MFVTFRSFELEFVGFERNKVTGSVYALWYVWLKGTFNRVANIRVPVKAPQGAQSLVEHRNGVLLDNIPRLTSVLQSRSSRLLATAEAVAA